MSHFVIGAQDNSRQLKRKHTIQVNKFTTQISECVNNFILNNDHPLVDLERVVAECVDIVLKPGF